MPIVICPSCNQRKYVSPSEPSERTCSGCGQTFWTGAVTAERQIALTRIVSADLAIGARRSDATPHRHGLAARREEPDSRTDLS